MMKITFPLHVNKPIPLTDLSTVIRMCYLDEVK